MTVVHERTRSVVQTRDFLRDLAQNKSLPQAVRFQAKQLLRHYPEATDIWRAGRLEEERRMELSLLVGDLEPGSVALATWLLTEPFFCDDSPAK